MWPGATPADVDRLLLRALTAPCGPGRPARGIRAIVRIRLAGDVTRQTYEGRLREMPAVLSGEAIAGGCDLELRLACRDLAELERTTRALHRAGADSIHTDLVTRSLTGLGQTARTEKRTQ